MNQKKVNKALSAVAKREGITVDEVRKEIQFSIDEARKSKDPQVKKEWKKFGKNPSIESIFEYFSKNLLK